MVYLVINFLSTILSITLLSTNIYFIFSLTKPFIDLLILLRFTTKTWVSILILLVAEKVLYPGLKSHPGHDIAKKQMKDFRGMMSFNVRGGFEAGKMLMDSVNLISLATSLGNKKKNFEQKKILCKILFLFLIKFI